MKGFIVDNTISHIGHDFYYYFADRLRATSRLDFNLVVRERPDARWGSLVTVEFEREVVYRRFLPPNTTSSKTRPPTWSSSRLSSASCNACCRTPPTGEGRAMNNRNATRRRLPAGQPACARPGHRTGVHPGQPGVWRQPVERHLAAQQRPGAERLRRPGPEGPHLAFTGTSALERFSNQLESRMLGQLLDNISNGNTGSMSTDAFLIDVIDDSGA
jgi:hypothetical protein